MGNLQNINIWCGSAEPVPLTPYWVIDSAEKNFGFQLMNFRMLLAYVDVSDRYSFQDYLHLSEKKRSSLYQDYALRMKMQTHTTWVSWLAKGIQTIIIHVKFANRAPLSMLLMVEV